MIKKEEVISFVWQHILLLVSLYVMTFGVAACVRSQLGSSVISTIPYVMASAGKMLDYIPGWTIGGYTIMMNAVARKANNINSTCLPCMECFSTM